MTDKIATLLLILVLGSTMLLCLCYTAILVVPDVPFNPYPPTAATARAEATLIKIALEGLPPTATPTSLFPATWTPTTTASPTWTLTPTETRTPTPTWTSSPTPTNRPTRTSTALPSPTLTGTALPTDTAEPPLYRVASNGGQANCQVIRVIGVIRDASGIPIPGVSLQVGEVGVSGSVFRTQPTDPNGRYVHDFGGPTTRPQVWFVVPLNGGEPAAERRFEFQSDPIDLCEFDQAIQIMTVDWIRRN